MISDIISLESLLLKQFQEEPFHNLYLLYGKNPLGGRYGGTCSDKTLSFIDIARSFGFNVALHTAYIGGKEIHRLVRVTIENRIFFADVGNGWPSVRLYPSDEEICFTCFGIKFRTELSENRILIYQIRNDYEFLQLEIDPVARHEKDIIDSIAKRFNSGIIYPFGNTLRFSLIVEDRFLFLRDDTLEIYENGSAIVIKKIKQENLCQILKEEFNFNTVSLFKYLEKINGY